MSQNEPVRPDSEIAHPPRPTPISCDNEVPVKYASQPVSNPISFDTKPTDDKGRHSLMPGDCVELVSVLVDIDALRSKCLAEYGNANGPCDYPLWLHFAFDLSTYSMLAVNFDIFRPDAHTWRSILAMCGTDKDRIAAIFGARRNWKVGAVPRLIVTDDSPVFRSDAFRDALALLGANHVSRSEGNLRSASAIRSMLRQVVGSIMSTDNLSQWLNPAIMPLEFRIGTALVCAVVDHYQAEPMQGLCGKSPDMAWYEACKLHGTPRLLTEHEARELLDATSFEDRPTDF